MSEAWEMLFKDDTQALKQCLRLERVAISKKSGAICVRFQSSRLLESRELHAIEARFANAFPAQRVEVQVRYHALKARFLETPSFAIQVLRSRLVEHNPGLIHFLSWQKEHWSLDNNELTLLVNSQEGARLLKARQMERELEREIEDLFGASVSVRLRVTGDDEQLLQSITEAREKEAQIMAMGATTAPHTPAKKVVESDAIIGKTIHDAILPMNEITEDAGRFAVRGEVSGCEMRDTKNSKSKIVTFLMSDHLGSVNCKLFLGGKRGADENAKSMEAQAEQLAAVLKDGKWVTARGAYRYDDYRHEMVLMVSDLMEAEKPVRMDNAPEKRVELHLHTTFSTMDACASATQLIQQAAAWGHSAIAVTDHGVVQSFPEAFGAAKKAGIKLIPGCEGYLIDDNADIVKGATSERLSDSAYVVLDVETTGLNTSRDEIIEIGAVRYEHGVEVAEFSELIDPERPLPEEITKITGITSAMLHGKRTIDAAMPDFAAFCEGAILVAHNASFDLAFFKRAFERVGKPMPSVSLDTLALARNLYPTFKKYKLGHICKMLDVSLTNAHRAVHDARATAQVLMKMIAQVRAEKNVETLDELNTCFPIDTGKQSYHIILLATSQVGITNLYRLVSEAHIHYFHRTPRIPRSLISKYREGLIIGSACEAGELFRAVLHGENEETLERIARFYDYLEVQPIGNNGFLVREGTVPDENALRDLNRRIVALGDQLNIPVCATGDVHFKDPTDSIYRAILLDTRGFEDADYQPPLYFRTTEDMLEEFAYLGKEKAKEIVVTNTNLIASRVGDMKVFLPHPEGKPTFQPFWPEAENDLRTLTMQKAISIYGDPLPEIVQARIDKELGSICGYGFSTLYMIAVKLVAKSLSDGYIVGSRGSVGSSLVAFLSGITEVNSLPPHYVCPKCKHNEFDIPKEYSTGLDLPIKQCPVCGAQMDKDGFNIPFEVFLGFKGDKVPDIDLNFSGVYQPVAHNYIKELFGEEYCFRAGTIGTIAEKTAFGYVMKYAEKRNLSLSNAEKERLAKGITGVKRTTGQHPAGMVVLPKEYEIFQFTPIQHPADDTSTDTITTHFDFNSMHDVLVKLDVLGHDDPTMLRKLQDITGIAPQQVPLNDPEVFGKIISLFSGPEALGLTADELQVSESGTLGVPEFGTKFVRGMLKETRPTTMEELIRISGLSHGTDVWLGNARDLVMQGVPLRECICTRDDIMNQLISYGVEPSIAFRTMESVRKGKGLTEEMEVAIEGVDAPPWFIDSCKKIKYMFPKAHAVAYVTMALRIAYFKIFYPAAYYCCYLFRNAESFDATRMTTSDVNVLLGRIEEIKAMDKDTQTAKTEDENTILEMLVEMNRRGIHLRPIDIYESDAVEYKMLNDHEILPPINALPGVGSNAAEAFVQSRAGGPFISIDDMLRRKVPKGIIEMLRQGGCLNDIPETSQVTLFEFGM
ncbi:MAG: PolC-type DNA polymerase III [Clostridia bacterium]|nr:PolC-type DNA polymerase III [Clostridia bacterium]